jgi:WD40 repeat protein
MFRGGGGLSVTSLGFLPNGRTVISTSLDGMIRFWNLRDGSSRQTLVTTGYTDLRVTFSPIGKYIAAGTGDGVLCILDSRTQELVKRWEGHQNDISSPVFTPDGNGILSSSFDGIVKYWDVRPGTFTEENSVTLIRQFGGHPVRESDLHLLLQY